MMIVFICSRFFLVSTCLVFLYDIVIKNRDMKALQLKRIQQCVLSVLLSCTLSPYKLLEDLMEFTNGDCAKRDS